MAQPGAWHADPFDRFELRYWSGEKWTEHVSTGGSTSIDPPEHRPQEAGRPDVPSWPAPSVVESAADWTEHALMEAEWPVPPELIQAVTKALESNEWVLAAQKVGGVWFDHQIAVSKVGTWVVVSSQRLLIFTERGIINARMDLTRSWPLAACDDVNFGALYGAGPTWEVALGVADGNTRHSMSIYCDDPPKSELVCSAINAARQGTRGGLPLDQPSGHWSLSYTAATSAGEELQAANPDELAELLRDRPERCVLMVHERQTGRAEFDSRTPCASFIERAASLGYQLSSCDVLGTPPNHGWMGPGDRFARIKLARNEIAHAARSNEPIVQEPLDGYLEDFGELDRADRSPIERPPGFPEIDQPANLLAEYRRRYGTGDLLSIYQHRRWTFESGEAIESWGDDQELRFWLNALPALSGLRCGRRPFPLASFCGLAEQVLDRTNRQQVETTNEIQRRFHGQNAVLASLPDSSADTSVGEAAVAQAAAWYADPFGRFQHRYWDGESWTEHVSTNGTASTDPTV
jgi:hypothetical protein